MQNLDYVEAYKRLGLELGSDATAIRKAWRGMVRNYHPDLAKSDPEAANEKLAEINAAFDLLCQAEELQAAHRAAEAEKQAKQKEARRIWALYQARAREAEARRAEKAKRAATSAQSNIRQLPQPAPASVEASTQRTAKRAFSVARRVLSGQPFKAQRRTYA